ncbi:MAG TPA: 3'-5' exonuclease [Erysipelotrichaceae bacterium]|nr:3'-5' exonuclease [Erysipelotrichaceae bacterium]
MKKISEFKEKDRLEMPLLVKEVKNGTTNKGAPYLSVIVQDSSGTIDGKFWDVKPEDQKVVKTGKIVMFHFDVLLYNQKLQLRITKAEPADEGAVDMSAFVIASEVSEERRKQQLESFIASIKSPVLQKLVRGMLAKAGEKFFTYPAASRIHHSFLGGLSEHSLSMAEMAENVCGHYPQLNRDLLIAGTLVHDLGKTLEMSGPVTTEYTLKGKLEGHISLANGWLSEVAEELGLEDCEETVLLHHMILSHHGHLEFGSPVVPMLQEAEVLCMIDNLDARMNTLKQALGAIEPGEWTSKLFALENRQFYKPKGE